ncbi:hypothetical protein BDR05DRAFT_989655 [Suillus weaverae]|nr:hypothetical protein BDR05DRAFT_989655 [Suillus weaverae]
MPNNIPTLNSRAVVKDLVDRLGSLHHFLDAINDVMKFSDLDDCELQCYGRKIIALTYVACMTLRYKGPRLCLLVGCSKEFLPYKSAYFKLLVWIKRRRDAFPADLHITINVLLFPIDHAFAKQCRGVDPLAQLGIDELLVSKDTPTSGFESCLETRQENSPLAVSSEQKSPTSSSETPNEQALGAFLPSKAVCSRISNESPTL